MSKTMKLLGLKNRERFLMKRAGAGNTDIPAPLFIQMFDH